ncbi:hypothetical protein GGD62_006491 [Bradyrhizobium sp. ERR14]|nr:hypothetical protein [Bradyrhizobium sp. ERR14]
MPRAVAAFGGQMVTKGMELAVHRGSGQKPIGHRGRPAWTKEEPM